MALKFFDSFDNYVTADLLEKWTARIDDAADPAIASGGRAGNCLKWSGGQNQSMGQLTLTPQHGPGDATCFCGFALRVTSLADLNYASVAAFLGIGAGGGYQYLLWLNPDGSWGAGLTSATYTSSGVPIVENTWAYVELKIVVANSPNGSIELRVNRTPVLSQTGIDTQYQGTTGWTSVVLLPAPSGAGWGPRFTSAGGGTIEIDDFYLLDGTTGTGRANNDFWGDTSIRYSAPTSNGTTNEWDRTGGGSANYEAIDDSAPDDDTTYVSTAVLNEVDLYNLPDVVAGAECYGVQVCVSAKKGTAGSAQLAGVVKTSGNSPVVHGTPLGVASEAAYNYFLFPWDGNPDSTSDWTESDLNALQIGIKKTV